MAGAFFMPNLCRPDRAGTDPDTGVTMSETSAEQPAQTGGEDDAQTQQMLSDAVASGHLTPQPETPAPQEPAASNETTEAPAEEEQDSGDKDWESEATKWKALARQHENRHLNALGLKSKAELDSLREAAGKYAEVEESQKTEQQKLTDRATAAEQQLADVQAANARLMAAATHNIPPELIEFLGSGSEEDINARAETLAERLKATAPAPPVNKRPVESLTPGAAPSSAKPADPDAWIRNLAGRST